MSIMNTYWRSKKKVNKHCKYNVHIYEKKKDLPYKLSNPTSETIHASSIFIISFF